MKWLDKSFRFQRLYAGENIECSSTSKEKSKSRARNSIRPRMCNIIQRQKKKRANHKNHNCAYSSTASRSGDEDSVFTSSTIVSRSSSIQHTTDMTETVPLSPNRLKENERCRRETKGTSYDDSFARPSKSMKKSQMNANITGDRDIWEERILVNKHTGEQRSFFYSTNTGFRLMDEPPTGASYIIYLEN